MDSIGYSTLWKAIIRPPRATYALSELGPYEYDYGGLKVARTDLELTSPRGFKMQCSHFEPLETERQWHDMPCVIYMHGNSSCRVEGAQLVPFLL